VHLYFPIEVLEFLHDFLRCEFHSNSTKFAEYKGVNQTFYFRDLVFLEFRLCAKQTESYGKLVAAVRNKRARRWRCTARNGDDFGADCTEGGSQSSKNEISPQLLSKSPWPDTPVTGLLRVSPNCPPEVASAIVVHCIHLCIFLALC
jgi:hypothetical protein